MSVYELLAPNRNNYTLYAENFTGSTGGTVTTGTLESQSGNILLGPSSTGNIVTLAVQESTARTVSLIALPNNTVLAQVNQHTNPSYAQATNNTTSVSTLNSYAGKVQMNSVAAPGLTSFNIYNPIINSISQIIVGIMGLGSVSATTFLPLSVYISGQANGVVTINVSNPDGVHSSAAAPVIWYLIG